MHNSLLYAAFFTPMEGGFWGLPLCAWGPPGVAKTASYRQLGRRLVGCKVEVLSPGERGEGAFGVTPLPITSDGRTYLTYPAPEWLLNLGEGPSIVLVDEIGSCPPALQPALLGLVQDRRIGGQIMPKSARVFGAGNPSNIAAGGYDISPPNANRMGHLQWDPPEVDEWTAHMLAAQDEQGATVDVAREEKRVLAAWPGAYAKAVGLITAFLKRRPEMLHKMPPYGDPQASRAWPSPRTWEYGTRSLASAMIHFNEDETLTDQLISSFVGNAAAGEFATWRAQQDLPDPADVLDGRVKFVHEEHRLDRTLAVLSSCAALVRPENATKRPERADALWKIFERHVDEIPDLLVPAMRAISPQSVGLTKSPLAVKVLAKMLPIMNAAGLTQSAGRR